jgi:SAM-dependent methyltransferase
MQTGRHQLSKAAAVRSSLKRRLRRLFGAAPAQPRFSTSEAYWDERYRLGGHSGAGSYGRLARFKADFLNRFVKDHDIASVIEFGSGDGAQLVLAEYRNYLGVDVSEEAVARCRSLYDARPGFRFIHLSEVEGAKADLALSLDVIYHLVEDQVYVDYMQRLFDAALRYVIIYASNWEERSVAHVRHRRFTDWVEANRGGFDLARFQANEFPFDPQDPDNTSFADFYIYQRQPRPAE